MNEKWGAVRVFGKYGRSPRSGAVVGLSCLLAGMLCAPGLRGQSADEHASHHAGAPGAGAAGMGAPTGIAGGPMAQMGEMMKSMGAPPPKQLYPALMTLPELTPEERQQVQEQAMQRMRAGVALMGDALNLLRASTESGDYAAGRAATTRLREGVAEFESGVAARRALAEGRAPRDVALAWFKQELKLSSPAVDEAAARGLGLSWFHLFTMALLVAFAFAMLAMYFFKMRRAAALFRRIEPGPDSPPPGSSPPLSGIPGPPVPLSRAPGGQTDTSTPLSSDNAKSVQPENRSPRTDPGDPTSLSPNPVAGGAAPPTQPATGHPARDSPQNPVEPLTAKWAGRLQVEAIIPETPSVRTFRLRSPSGGPLPITYLPGQFLNVAFGIGGAKMNRSYSISSSPNERDYLDLTVKREERGAVSRHLNDLIKVGDEIEAAGPVGKFTFTGAEAESIVLLGAGVGITPMMSVARYLSERSWPGEIFFVYGCRAPSDLIFRDAIAALERSNPKLHAVITMSKPTPDWQGPRGRISKEFLLHAVPHLASRRVHLCGPPAMMESIKLLLTEIGVAPENLKTEAFGAVKPAPATGGTSAKATAVPTGPLVTFSQSGKAAKIGLDQSGEQAALATGPDQTILELSEELGIGIEFSCRIGTCGVCKVKMIGGEVDMAIDDALDDDDKKNGLILACQAKPKTAVTVDA